MSFYRIGYVGPVEIVMSAKRQRSHDAACRIRRITWPLARAEVAQQTLLRAAVRICKSAPAQLMPV
eukprot:scaffold19698_cov125-Isochrysis_galbana.AAC.6